MVLQMDPAEHARRVSTKNWDGFIFPVGAELPRPWHKSDEDSAFRQIPTTKVPNSEAIIEHLKANGTLNIGTGSVEPTYDGRTGGVLLNEARPTDKMYTISKENGPNNLCVTTGWSAPYGKKVRIGDHMVTQGYPMRDYADHKLHIYDPIDNTITEIQFLIETRRNPFLMAILNFLKFFGIGKGGGGYQCHGVSQFSLDDPSTEAVGSSAANVSISETTLRIGDVIDGVLMMTAMAVTKPSAHRSKFVWPAEGTDGTSTDENAIQMGMLLKLKEEKLTDLSSDIQIGDQALHIAKCWAAHGIMVIDTAGHQTTSLEPSALWDQLDLERLVSLMSLDDFDVYILDKP